MFPCLYLQHKELRKLILFFSLFFIMDLSSVFQQCFFYLLVQNSSYRARFMDALFYGTGVPIPNAGNSIYCNTLFGAHLMKDHIFSYWPPKSLRSSLEGHSSYPHPGAFMQFPRKDFLSGTIPPWKYTSQILF